MSSVPLASSDADGFEQLGFGRVAADGERTPSAGAQHARHGRRAAGPPTATRRQRRRPKVTVVGVIGEVLLTMGVVMLLFVGWKYWLNDIIVGNEQNRSGAQLGGELDAQAQEGSASTPDHAGIPVLPQPTEINERFAILYVPAWGADYSRPIAQGTGYYEVLDENVGHYEQSVMPGAIGNFAIAGHRLAYGASMQFIHELQVGDEVVVETVDGWYTYLYRSGEYVAPTQVDVLNPIPRAPATPTGLEGERIMTLMSCNPFWSTAERIIAYAVFDSFTPRADGPPVSIAGSPAAGGAA